ncbi:IPT/TIG domain-containing protein [Desertivirga brevis]|uniref:IPT/TIG domain-containing protein n=1 Tax=Desertivirga brevis TaxID=2810310 RepID=UPI001A97AC3D|nr:IPT/TIG domain-containing protein [Pedobacter sp. SYSU D00873]
MKIILPKSLYSLTCLILFLCVLVGCKKDEESHPEIRTINVQAISPAKVKATGEIVHKGSFKIIDHGFLYGSSSAVTAGAGTKVSLGANVNEQTISSEFTVTSSSSYDRTVFVRAYLTDENGTAYGSVVSVQLPNTAVSSVSPSYGKTGDQITLSGNFYSLSKDEVQVTFANVSANIVSINSSKIVVEVPSGINSSSYSYNQIPISVNVGGGITQLSSSFKLIPTFNDFSPKSGHLNTTISISATNLPSYYSYNSLRVYFGSVASTSNFSINSGLLTVSIPSNVTEEKFQIAVEIDGIKTVIPGEFTLIPPTVSSISPSSGLAGSSFSIFGNNFYNSNSYYPGGISVTIGDVPATNVNIVSTGQINVTIPNDFPVGDHKVVLKCGPFNVEAPQRLRVKPITISNFSPSSGAPGKEVTIQGDFVPNYNYTVYFGSITTSTYSTSTTALKVNVPAGVSTGEVKISVRAGNTTVTAADNFTVLAPSITSFSPTSGVAGTEVTIHGTGFTPGPYLYNNSVKFGTVVATPIIAPTDSSIKVLVPSGLTPGAMKISVTNSYGQTVVSQNNFTFTTQ